MWEEGSQVMEKKTAPRQSTGLTKSNIPCEKKIGELRLFGTAVYTFTESERYWSYATNAIIIIKY